MSLPPHQRNPSLPPANNPPMFPIRTRPRRVHAPSTLHPPPLPRCTPRRPSNPAYCPPAPQQPHPPPPS
ncbi:hypothetical protein BD779DRAFT_1558676, partial [Infundibulicybe gibba]